MIAITKCFLSMKNQYVGRQETQHLRPKWYYAKPLDVVSKHYPTDYIISVLVYSKNNDGRQKKKKSEH